MAEGYFKVWPVDSQNKVIGDTRDPPNPHDPKALDFYFGVPNTALHPPQEQVDLQAEIAKVIHALRTLFGQDEARFRPYYVRLFALAQLGLEGANASTLLAKNALAAMIGELIDEESGRVKNRHLRILGTRAAIFALPFGIAYLVTCVDSLAPLLGCLGIQRPVFSNFLLLWIGAMLGVWLSYAIRTTTFSLRDLFITDSDRLAPEIRLLYAGFLTMALGMIFVAGIADVRIGEVSVSEIASYPMLAFLVGLLCGVSELTLPAALKKRAGDAVARMQ